MTADAAAPRSADASLPASWRGEVEGRLEPGEQAIARLEFDLDERLRYAPCLLILTPRRLMAAGAEIVLHPEMAHAKVLRIDDRVLVGGCNLDDLSLFRNDELNLLFDDATIAERTEQDVFDELAAMSTPASVPSDPRERAWNAAMDRISRLL